MNTVTVPKWAPWAAGVVFLLAVLMAFDGCQKPPDENPVADDRSYDRVVLVGIDLSGSMMESMAKEGRAYAFLLRVLDTYLRGGANEKLILTQLSGNGRPALIWDGTPADLRRAFPDAAAFHAFLLSKADPNGSRLYDGITESVSYFLAMPGVTPKTKCVLVCLSDMDDNVSAPGAEQRLLAVLAEFGKKGNAAGFYFVNVTNVPRWRANLKPLVTNHCVSSAIETSPPLPQLD